MLATVRSPRQLIIGEGTAPAVGPLTASLGQRALLVSDRVLADQPLFATVRDALADAGVEVHEFVDAVADVPLEVIDRSVAAARGVAPEVIVGLGGGTVLDLAKMTALLLSHGGSPRDYYGEQQVPGPTLPVVALPTTAGTGSEVTTVAVVSDPDQELKVGVSSVHLMPEFAICDPDLTRSCPPTVTAHAGVDALCHAVEAYTAARREVGWEQYVHGVFTGKNAFSDELALRAVRAIGRYLPTAVANGEDRDARRWVMLGATEAGLAFGHAGTAAPHALQYPLGAATETPHGLGVGLLLPYVLTANKPLVRQELQDLAGCVGLDGDADPAESFIDWTVELDRRVGIPTSLQEIGVARDDLRNLAEKTTLVTRLLANNPGRSDADALEHILHAAWEGKRELLT